MNRRRPTIREGLHNLAEMMPSGDHARDAFEQGIDEFLNGDREPETPEEQEAHDAMVDELGDLMNMPSTDTLRRAQRRDQEGAIAVDQPKIDKCKSCKAPIIWAVTVRGKRIPLDADPTMKGNMVIDVDRPEGNDGPEIVRARVVSPLLEPGQVRYMPHHATCVDAKRWRR